MNVSGDLFSDHGHALSRRKLCLRMMMRFGVLLSMAFVGCLYLSTMRGAVALPRIPIVAPHAMVLSVSTLPHEVYYYRGRYYPYRYRGAYYGHRYYRYGRWHYY
jgi:hypothetical protein